MVTALFLPDRYLASCREVNADLFVGHEAPLARVRNNNRGSYCFLELSQFCRDLSEGDLIVELFVHCGFQLSYPAVPAELSVLSSLKSRGER